LTDLSSSINKNLISVLLQELEAFEEFKVLLLSEQEALIKGDTSGITEVTEIKDTRIKKLNELSIYRSKLVVSLGIPESKDGFSEWINQAPEEISALWDTLVKTAKGIQRLNDINGKLINTRLQHTQQTLAALLNALDQENLYGPDGQRNAVPPTTNIRGIIGKA